MWPFVKSVHIVINHPQYEVGKASRKGPGKRYVLTNIKHPRDALSSVVKDNFDFVFALWFNVPVSIWSKSGGAATVSWAWP